MNTREYLLRYGWITSERVAALRDHQQLFFLKLGHVADGAARFDADAALLRVALYPRQLHKVSERDVQGMLAQLHQTGLVRLYTRAGKGYGEILNFGQRDTNRKVLYPPPEAEPDLFTSGDESFAAPPSEMNRRETPQSPPAGGLENPPAPVSQAGKRRRSPERTLKTAREELEEVERELTDLLYPGGCSFKVTPTGDKAQRYQTLMARRTTLKATVGAARSEIREVEHV